MLNVSSTYVRAPAQRSDFVVCFLGEYMVPGPVGEAPLVAAVLVVEVLRQLLDHLELPGLVLVVAVTNSRLDDIFVHRA